MISSRRLSCVVGRLLVVLSYVLLLSWCAIAHADMELVQGVELSLVRGEGADGCIAADLVEDEVRERLGRDPFTRPVRQHIECLITREGSAFIARLHERDISGRRIGNREISASTLNCRDLDDALALAIALIIDPEFLTGGAPLQSVPNASSSHSYSQRGRSSPAAGSLISSVELVPTTGVVEFVVPAAIGDSRVMVGLGGSIGLLPGLGPDFSVSFQRRVRSNWHGHLSVLWAPERKLSDATSSVGFGLTATRLAGCYEGNQDEALFGCAGVGVGMIHSVVYGPQPVHPGDRLWAAMSADFGGRIAFGPVAVELRGQAIVPLLHWNFDLVSGKGVYREAWVVPALTLLVGMHFP